MKGTNPTTTYTTRTPILIVQVICVVLQNILTCWRPGTPHHLKLPVVIALLSWITLCHLLILNAIKTHKLLPDTTSAAASSSLFSSPTRPVSPPITCLYQWFAGLVSSLSAPSQSNVTCRWQRSKSHLCCLHSPSTPTLQGAHRFGDSATYPFRQLRGYKSRKPRARLQGESCFGTLHICSTNVPSHCSQGHSSDTLAIRVCHLCDVFGVCVCGASDTFRAICALCKTALIFLMHVDDYCF